MKPTEFFDITLPGGIWELINEFNEREEIVSIADPLIIPEQFMDVSIANPTTPEDYVRFLKDDLLPHLINVGKPGYIGHMTGMVPEFVKQLSNLMISLNQNVIKIETSSAATLVERQVLGIFHQQIFKFGDVFYERHVQNENSCLGIITNGGTISNISALSYALNKKLSARDDFRGIVVEGLTKALAHYNYNSVVVIGSKLMHYSIEKALKLLGLGTSNLITYDLDESNLELSKRELISIIESLRKKNILVLAIVGVAGATETGRVDPLVHLGNIALQFDIHYHVDAAFGGPYIFSEKLSKKIAGTELADSITICGHKQLFLPQGASMCIFKSPEFASHSQNESYYQARTGSYDLGKYTLEGSRSFISLVIHGVLKIFGAGQLGALVELNYEKTCVFAKMIRKNSAFQLFEEPTLNIITYRYIPEFLREKALTKDLTHQELSLINDLNRRLQKEQFLRAKSFVSFTEIPMEKDSGSREVILRIVVMNPFTTEDIFQALLDEQIQIAAEIFE